MNLFLAGDLHGTDKAPENRTDNYEEAWMNKFTWMLDTSISEKCDLFLQPADFFDGPNTSYSFFERVVRTINKSGVKILTTYGQHDLRYRTKSNCSLTALSASCPNLFLGSYPNIYKTPDIFFHFSGWEEPLPKPSLKIFNVLITHRMIVHTKLWEDQEDFEYADNFLEKHRFDLVVSGDNHQSFIVKNGNRYLINCGSMMRSNIKQVDHKPMVYIFDTKERRLKTIPVPIFPPEKVFKMEEVAKTKEHNEKLESFIEGLSQHKDMGLSFTDNLFSYMKKNNIEEPIQDLFRRLLRS
ncbi:MAG: metallophosphoesterase [Methanogenium sp.]|jgi:hypothetical protein